MVSGPGICSIGFWTPDTLSGRWSLPWFFSCTLCFFSPVIEIYRKRGKWRFSYDSDAGASPVPWYDEDGKLKEVLWCGNPEGRVESPAEFATQVECREYVSEVFKEEEIKVRPPGKPRKSGSDRTLSPPDPGGV